MWLARAGLPFGLVLAALAVTGWTMPSGDPPSPAAVALVVGPTGEIAVDPSGTLTRMATLRPGRTRRGAFVVTNTTNAARTASLRVATPLRDLDSALRVHAEVDGRAVFDGLLRDARKWMPAGVLGSGRRRRVSVGLALPRTARGHEYRAADVRVELRSEPAP